jgi:hypothetical protein
MFVSMYFEGKSLKQHSPFYQLPILQEQVKSLTNSTVCVELVRFAQGLVGLQSYCIARISNSGGVHGHLETNIHV